MRRLGRLMAISVFCVCAQAGVAQAGFFDFLFNNNRPPPPPPSQNFSFDPAADARAAQARKAARLKYEAKKRAAIAAKAAAGDGSHVDARAKALEFVRRLSAVVATQGPQAAFLQDPTLRSGDIVVMRTGIAVFDGDGRSAHRPNQFRPLARSSLHGRSDLALLQRASGFRPASEPGAANEPRSLTISASSDRAKTDDSKPWVAISPETHPVRVISEINCLARPGVECPTVAAAQ